MSPTVAILAGLGLITVGTLLVLAGSRWADRYLEQTLTAALDTDVDIWTDEDDAELDRILTEGAA